MKILILGANPIGATLAENLSREANDITVVDANNEQLRELKDRLDIATISGRPSHPDVLKRAGANDADMLIAVTDSDETNLVACQVAWTLFNTPKKICRLHANSYVNATKLFGNTAIPVDVVISPEQIVSQAIKYLLELPGALQVLDFAGGRIQLVAVRAEFGGPLVGHQIRYLREHMPASIDSRVAAIFRRNQSIRPQGDTVIEANDEVFFIAAREHIPYVMRELREVDEPYRKIIIAGGGAIGERLAQAVESRCRTKIIELNEQRCEYLADRLSSVTVLRGDASDQDLLLEEGIEETDVFLALTNNDEANIMSSLLAKRLGAGKVMTLIAHPPYVDLVQGGAIDIAISPQLATIGTLLAHVRRGDVAKVHSLRRGAAEAIEAIAHGDPSTSKVVGRSLGEIPLPPGTTIGAILRNDQVLIAHDNIVLESNDHVILFLVDHAYIKAVERLFQVGFTFF